MSDERLTDEALAELLEEAEEKGPKAMMMGDMLVHVSSAMVLLPSTVETLVREVLMWRKEARRSAPHLE